MTEINCKCGVKYDISQIEKHMRSNQHRSYENKRTAKEYIKCMDVLEDLDDIEDIKKALLKMKSLSAYLLAKYKMLE